jgi:type IV pilus assembly protein PilO
MKLPNIDFTNRNVQLGLLTTAGMLGVLYFYFFTRFLPVCYPAREAKVTELREKVGKLTTEVEQAKRTTANLPRLEKEMTELHARWELATNLLPPEKEIAVLLRKVTVAGQQAGVDFLNFEPSATVAQNFYTEHPVSVKVTGGYHEFGNFIARLANMSRIVNVSDLILAGISADRDKGDKDKEKELNQTVEATMTVTAYSIGATETAAIEAQKATAPGGKPEDPNVVATREKRGSDDAQTK